MSDEGINGPRSGGEWPKGSGSNGRADESPSAAGSDAHSASEREQILFVTGKLAERSLRRVIDRLGTTAGFDGQVAVLPITVAALMHVDWVARKLEVQEQVDRVVLPGWCQGDLSVLARHFGVHFERGPKDLHDLPEHFGRESVRPELADYDIEILAEINHAPRMTDAEILGMATSMRSDGADVIDLGCIPGYCWKRAGDVTRILRGEDFRVSIDSFDRHEVEESVAAGAELVLSCNSTNVDWVAPLAVATGAELVAIPDDIHDLATLDHTIERLEACNARYRIDAILEPIGHGFGRSVERFFAARKRWPKAEMMMGVGNITELTEVDSAGVNVLLAGLCQELEIRSVLTTQVINWARSSVRELDVARRLMHYSLANGVLPKHLDSRLVLLRHPKAGEMSAEEISEIAARITDPNYRVFVQGGTLHLLNRDGHWTGRDPFELFQQAAAAGKPIDPPHAFYLGYELCKAATALALGKQYTQDEALSWGFLTVPEQSHRERDVSTAGADPALKIRRETEKSARDEKLSGQTP